ncbi:hypothetical protein Bhyg_02615 [Pseudolycoriella hygida]|uniref:Uncharacterized protein n=1 Tax=Pseudolycoriella hygida TaxID=35572 RepID=A0A9Q0S7X8_9DIPT|nr:hypothetical protein Bhyg_02615 [Pseudolycoriella hygida]
MYVAGVSATTEQSSAPSVPQQGSSTLQLTDEPHMSIAAENAGMLRRLLTHCQAQYKVRKSLKETRRRTK